jgi:SAM-dependent methyltransferase/glycosyltransferase involved in cell wall biosynthesis
MGEDEGGGEMLALQGRQGINPCPTPLARVEYEDLSGFEKAARVEDWDVLVCCRFVRGIAEARFAKRCVLWGHDVLTEETAPLVGGLLWKIDRIFVLSEFQKRQWQGHLPMAPDEAFLVTRNGVDLEVVDGRPPARDGTRALQGKRVIYASRPERGLEVLLDIWPHLKRRHPDLELVLCRYDHPAGDAEMAEFLAMLERRIERLEGITFLGGLSKPELYEVMRTCRLMLYPSVFPEVSCITALEAAGCRMPIITSKYCALKETVADGVSGILIGGDPRSADYQQQFIEAADALLSDEGRCRRMGEAARRRVEREYRWSEIAREWTALFEEWFANAPGGRVLAHLKHNSDLIAARDAHLASAEELGIEWLEDEKGYREHYEEAWQRAADGDGILRGVYPEAGRRAENDNNGNAGAERCSARGSSAAAPLQGTGKHRFEWLLGQVAGRPEIRSVLDVGCGGGEFAVGLAKQIPGLRVVGADVSEAALAHARLLAVEQAREIERVTFTPWPVRVGQALAACRTGCGTPPTQPSPTRGEGCVAALGAGEDGSAAGVSEEDGILRGVYPEASRRAQNDKASVGAVREPPLQAVGEGFDAVFIGEVLEHVPDLEAYIEQVEALLKPGGWVFATLPFGPWESMSFDEDRKRGIKPSHVRSWGYRDVLDVFGNKAGLDLCHAECGYTSRGEPVGHWLLAYRASGETGRYDYARKLRCNPRQTLSVCMILGGPEAGQTLHRCLRSVRPIADEILIAWSNCDEETLRIAGQYGDVLFEIPWLEEDGLPNFAAARNRSIERASGDWILWIDADEYLVGAQNLAKYLRENIYNAYVIRQRHHAIDASFAPDTPMRCFRNGLGIKFFGAIHEHPEMRLNDGISPHVILTDVNVIHDGYVTEGKRVGRFQRNLPILVKDRRLFPERQLGYVFWLRDLVQAARHQMMAAGGMTRQAMACLEEAVRLYRERFADPGAEYHGQARPLYQQALMLLGRGRPLWLAIGGADGRDAIRPPVGRLADFPTEGEGGANTRFAPTAMLFESASEAAEYAAACARLALADPPWAREFEFEG